MRTVVTGSARPWARIVLAALAVACLLSLFPGSVLAHGGREVGEYHFTVGFFVEPAYEGQPNGVDLRVVDHDEEPVEGLAEALQVEVRMVDRPETVTLPLRAVFNQPGRYTADFVPTVPGAYSFHFTGTIGDQAVDETFTSEVDSFSGVKPLADLQFPERVASGRELQAALSGSSEAAIEAEDAAGAAATRANVALAVGVLGLLVGGAGLVFGLRKPRS